MTQGHSSTKAAAPDPPPRRPEPVSELEEAVRALLAELDEHIDYEDGYLSEYGKLLPAVERVRAALR